MGKAQNCSTYKWLVTGVIVNTPINKKYCSISAFLDDWGGDATQMNLNKSKVLRLKKKWVNGVKRAEYRADPSDKLFAENWRVLFTPIHEARVRRVGFVN